MTPIIRLNAVALIARLKSQGLSGRRLRREVGHRLRHAIEQRAGADVEVAVRMAADGTITVNMESPMKNIKAKKKYLKRIRPG
jgi:hypothetical protein